MKQTRSLIISLFLLWGNVVAASESADSLVLSKVFAYQRTFDKEKTGGIASNVYIKQYYHTQRRNPTLWLIPSMYTIAKGQRQFVSEQYSRLHYYGLDEFENSRQVYNTTIPRNRSTMSVLTAFTTPSLYNMTLYGDHILSPFCHENKRYYRYNTTLLGSNKARLHFQPRFFKNTQLITGTATIDLMTGRIIDVEYEGAYDMIKFHSLITQGEFPPRSLFPNYSQTDFDFRFAGNHIVSSFTAMYDCPIRLPDTVDVKGDRLLMDSIRPIDLTDKEQAVYATYDSLHAPHPDTTAVVAEDKEKKKSKRNYLKEFFWDFLGNHLVRSHVTESEDYRIKLSPLLEPQYISYSPSNGLSYKMKLNAYYHFKYGGGMTLYSSFGYNFKQNLFYFTIPFTITYAPKHNGYVSATWGNGNRIGSSTALEEIKREQGNLPELDNMNLTIFKDNYFTIRNNINLLPWMGLETGAIYHRRKAVNQDAMSMMGKPTEYHSLAPLARLKLHPWSKGPHITVNYERGLDIKDSRSRIYLPYERWEADAAYKQHMPSMQTLNIRVGSGIYTNKQKNYFMDYANFHANFLPGGWDDDWSGDFQLLSSSLYNESSFYLRGNASYESPLLCASFFPLLGRYVERERFYWSGLVIEHSRPYFELGYSFSCQYFSMGAFVNLLGTEFQKFGTKFTFELFRRW